ncbi:hypothetical protein ACTID9_01165 [Brevibacillus fluminis]|uniref:hypothetical protein n=1 Tax=Brevibacillus fluminis TaxID=511487 RepID=UPI003F8C1717
MPLPKDNVGKIVSLLEKFFDAQAGRMSVKRRPALIIGYETNFRSIHDVDYELLPISSLSNTMPDPTYDYFVDDQLYQQLSLTQPSYIRTHKITWSHVKNLRIENPICDLININHNIFNSILQLNEQWVTRRTKKSIYIPVAIESTQSI